jgi:uncharacterized protein (TIGR02757 family)
MNSKLKKELDSWYHKVNTPAFIPNDPVQFPHRYRDRPDVECAAFLAAAIAWGRRDLILRSCERLFARMGDHPAAYIIEPKWKNLGEANVHRTFFEKDLLYYCKGLRKMLLGHATLETLFAGGIWQGIAKYRAEMAAANGGCYSKHIANPDAGSACKRMHLALRWLVRREGPVDLGLWHNIHPADLCIPLDLHVGRTARTLGLLDPGRTANDRTSAESLTATLREYCPEDPVKYDYALFGMGVSGSQV